MADLSVTAPTFRAHHVAISAVDLAASIAFYEIFGFRVVHHWQDPAGASQIAHLRLGEFVLEIFWYAERTPAPSSAAALATDLPRVGVKHFGLQVESVAAVREFVLARGLATDVTITAGKTGVTYFFVADPSGILVEFLEDRRGI